MQVSHPCHDCPLPEEEMGCMAAAVHGLFECWVVADVGRVDVGMLAVGTLFVG